MTSAWVGRQGDEAELYARYAPKLRGHWLSGQDLKRQRRGCLLTRLVACCATSRPGRRC